MHDPQHLVPRRRAESVKAVLHRALHAHGMARRLPRRIAPATWERAVGVQIAARAQPTVVSGGVLHVLVQDHRWRDQLDAARNFLLEDLAGPSRESDALSELRELSASRKLALILSRRRGEHFENGGFPIVERPYRMEELVDAMRLALLRKT